MPGSLITELADANGLRFGSVFQDYTNEQAVVVQQGGDSGEVVAGAAAQDPAADDPALDLITNPQDAIKTFWSGFVAERPSKALYVLPDNFRAAKAVVAQSARASLGKTVSASYKEARAFCDEKVRKIAQDYRRINQKYIDPHFDMEFINGELNGDSTLVSLTGEPEKSIPKDVKRVSQIFRNPQFFTDGPSADDIRQGISGDCWFLAATATVCSNQQLIEKVCVARDEAVGVYGFVFFRDGEWRSTIIDDRLFLLASNYEARGNRRMALENGDLEVGTHREEYKQLYQTGSRSLFFAHCTNEDETWLPLLEKAFAKAHGDYGSITGGWTGEGVEDLTGGVTTQTIITNILDIERFWHDELKMVNEKFLFACGAYCLGSQRQIGSRDGITEGHAYSILKAVELSGKRFVLLRNPWGSSEWKGRWSDGSAEWTPEWLTKLGHTFGDDGKFWMEYSDMLDRFDDIDRTRLFDDTWNVTQAWTNMKVPWTADYLDTKFEFKLPKKGSVVVVLSQIDTRYFKGLEGQYDFELSFRIQRVKSRDYIVRSLQNQNMQRSCSVELNDLEPGSYSVIVKISANRFKGREKVEDVIKRAAADESKKHKLVKVGLSYDLAQVKGRVVRTKETDAELDQKLDQLLELRRRKSAEDRRKERLEQKKEKIIQARTDRRERARRRAERIKTQETEAKKSARKAAKHGQARLASHESKIQRTIHILGLLEKQLSHQVETKHGSEAKAERADCKETIRDIQSYIEGLYRKRDQIRADPGAPNPLGGSSGSSEDGDYPTPTSTVDGGVKSVAGEPDVLRIGHLPNGANGASEDGHLHVPVVKPRRRRRRSRSRRNRHRHNHANNHSPAPASESDQLDSGASGVSIVAPARSERGPDAIDLELTDMSDMEPSSDDESDCESVTGAEDDIRDPAQQRADLLKELVNAKFMSSADRKVDMSQEAHKDPWNAVCTCGLRVYAELQTVQVRVVHPKSETEGGLDDDDAALDATRGSNQVRITLEEQISLLEEGIREQQLNLVDYDFADEKELLGIGGNVAAIQFVMGEAGYGGEELLAG